MTFYCCRNVVLSQLQILNEFQLSTVTFNLIFIMNLKFNSAFNCLFFVSAIISAICLILEKFGPVKVAFIPLSISSICFVISLMILAWTNTPSSKLRPSVRHYPGESGYDQRAWDQDERSGNIWFFGLLCIAINLAALIVVSKHDFSSCLLLVLTVIATVGIKKIGIMAREWRRVI